MKFWKKTIAAILVSLMAGGLRTDCRYVIDDAVWKVTTRDGAGTAIQGNVPIVDVNGEPSFQFDGNKKNYIKLAPIGADVDFAGGFTVRFKARWNANSSWARIFDFAQTNEQDSIELGQRGTTGQLSIGCRYQGAGTDTNLGTITYNAVEEWEITYQGNVSPCSFTVWNKTKNTTSTVNGTRCPMYENKQRKNNYIGLSNWGGDAGANVNIMYLHITTSKGQEVVNLDAETVKKAQGS